MGIDNPIDYKVIQAEILSQNLSSVLRRYSEGLKAIGYKVINGGEYTELGIEWSVWCHPDYILMISKIHNIDCMEEDEFIDVLKTLLNKHNKSLVPYAILPCWDSPTFSEWIMFNSNART